MNPYLFQNDLLNYIPVSDRLPATGDIVVFRDPAGSDRVIIHRVVKILPGGYYITKGDNNPSDDRYPIHGSDILGIVTGGVRANRPLFVSSGFFGAVCHSTAQQRRILMPVLQRVFFVFYYFLSEKGLFYRLLPEQFRQRVIIVKTNEGHDLQVYLGTHLAGWKGERDPGWTIIPPCRLFLDCAALPDSYVDFLREE